VRRVRFLPFTRFSRKDVTTAARLTARLQNRRMIACTGIVLAVGSAGPAAAGWDVGNVELDNDHSWTSDAGSGKTQTLTSTSAEVLGNSTSAGGTNSPNSSNLDRVYKRQYIEVIGGGDFPWTKLKPRTPVWRMARRISRIGGVQVLRSR
jgi:hypothetical protein